MWFSIVLACANNPDIGPVVPEQENKILPENNVGQTDKAPPVEPPSMTPNYNPEELVTISGTVSYSGESSGEIHIEALQNNPESPNPTLLQRAELEKMGDFSLQVPKNTLSISLMIYVDLTGNQISEDDPRGYYEFQTKEEDITGIEVTILNEDEMKDAKGDKKEDKKEDKKPE